MEKVLKQNLRKGVVYKNKPRPAARDHSRNTASEACKIFLKILFNVSTLSQSVFNTLRASVQYIRTSISA